MSDDDIFITELETRLTDDFHAAPAAVCDAMPDVTEEEVILLLRIASRKCLSATAPCCLNSDWRG